LALQHTTISPSETAAHAYHYQFVLATDLDGTFLGGDDSAREKLYYLIRSMRSEVFLIFLTGRSVDATLPILSDQLIPTPDILVADVGATIVDGETLEPISDIQFELSRNWPGEANIVEKLAKFDGLRRQKVPQENRVSYYIDANAPLDTITSYIQDQLNCSVIYSDNQYLDILPSDVSKGTTLDKIVKKYGIAEDKVLVAGDSLNDLSLFKTIYSGVAVANLEVALQRCLKDCQNVFAASKPGAAGILEGLGHHRMVSNDALDNIVQDQSFGEFDFIVACHRLPLKSQKTPQGTVVSAVKNPNGLIATLLRFFDGGKEGLWVACSSAPSRTPKNFEEKIDVDLTKYPNLKAARVPLTEKDINVFHKKFCKESLWPVIFSFPGKAKFDFDRWDHYREINRIFAERIANEAAEGALVWFHDYPLWMVPHYLRELRPDLKIAFFHHTSFPSADVFNVIPWSREIVSSILQCDYIGFHIPRYVENFVDVVKSHFPAEVIGHKPCAPRFLSFGCSLGIQSTPTGLRINDREIGLGAHPVGIDSSQIATELQKKSVQDHTSKILSELNGAKCILSIERLDYVKGPIEKLLAFEKLLTDHPELHGKITLVNICTPPPAGQSVFASTRRQVDEIVGRINGELSGIGWKPITYFYRSLSFEEVVAYYGAADIAWVTPLRDGLNLVAKEYIATQTALGRSGVLVISEFAGASVELQGAILTNPYEPTSMAQRLFQALSLSEEERKQRMQSLSEIVTNHDLNHWIDDYMRGVHAYTGEQQ
jgi:glucosylglycerol-phosphate synthase/sucrose-6F-phosphate phosphohydrolase